MPNWQATDARTDTRRTAVLQGDPLGGKGRVGAMWNEEQAAFWAGSRYGDAYRGAVKDATGPTIPRLRLRRPLMPFTRCSSPKRPSQNPVGAENHWVPEAEVSWVLQRSRLPPSMNPASTEKR